MPLLLPNACKKEHHKRQIRAVGLLAESRPMQVLVTPPTYQANSQLDSTRHTPRLSAFSCQVQIARKKLLRIKSSSGLRDRHVG